GAYRWPVIGRPEYDLQFLPPARGNGHILEYFPEFVRDYMIYRSVVHGFCNSIGGLFFFHLERSEQFVPDNQHATEVLVDVLLVARVMYTVMRRRTQNPFEPSKLSDYFSMLEECNSQDDGITN